MSLLEEALDVYPGPWVKLSLESMNVLLGVRDLSTICTIMATQKEEFPLVAE
jgi:hypothetical protein